MTVATQQVLIIEDDANIRETMTDLLHYHGYTVYEATDGKLALQHLRRSKERLVVLLDLCMPGMDGRALLRAVATADALAIRRMNWWRLARVGRSALTMVPSLDRSAVRMRSECGHCAVLVRLLCCHCAATVLPLCCQRLQAMRRQRARARQKRDRSETEAGRQGAKNTNPHTR
jgi:AmiR/NasT family two-component response regulator